MDMKPTTQTIPLPQGYDTAEELYLVTHASIGLILADVDFGFCTADEALLKIVEARKEASTYITALYEAGQL